MSYVLPKHLSHKFDISLQTVYNYLNKYQWSIRTKKESGKTYIHSDDFTKFIQGSSNDFKSKIKTPVPDSSFEKSDALQDHLKDLETENRNLAIQLEHKEKYNSNLDSQLAKYVELYKEEKSEKQELLSKYDTLHEEFSSKVETLFREKLKIQSRYYFLLAIAILLLLYFGWNMVLSSLGKNF